MLLKWKQPEGKPRFRKKQCALLRLESGPCCVIDVCSAHLAKSTGDITAKSALTSADDSWRQRDLTDCEGKRSHSHKARLQRRPQPIFDVKRSISFRSCCFADQPVILSESLHVQNSVSLLSFSLKSQFVCFQAARIGNECT